MTRSNIKKMVDNIIEDEIEDNIIEDENNDADELNNDENADTEEFNNDESNNDENNTNENSKNNSAINSDDDTNSNNNQKPVKNKVGRPRKIKTDKLVAIYGIVDKPQVESNNMELICHDPSIFKKIIALLKSFQVDNVEFVFTSTHINIFTEDHDKNSKIFIKFDCNKLLHYYINPNCKNKDNRTEIRVCIARIDIDDFFNSIDKTYDNFKMIINKKDANSYISFGLHHVPYDDEQTISIPVKTYHNIVSKPVISSGDYPIRFTLSTKVFKQIIEKMTKTFSKINISVNKDSKNSNIEFSARIQHGKSMSINFNDNNKILLEDHSSEDDIITINVMSEYIILLAKTTMGDNIKLWIDNKRELFSQMSLSNICFIDVFTKICEN